MLFIMNGGVRLFNFVKVDCRRGVCSWESVGTVILLWGVNNLWGESVILMYM